MKTTFSFVFAYFKLVEHIHSYLFYSQLNNDGNELYYTVIEEYKGWNFCFPAQTDFCYLPALTNFTDT